MHPGFQNLSLVQSKVEVLMNFHHIDIYSHKIQHKFLSTLKTFMNEATERGYNKKLDFRGRRFKRISETVESIYLNLEELKKIEMLGLSEKPNLERVRDLFLIGYLTCLLLF